MRLQSVLFSVVSKGASSFFSLCSIPLWNGPWFPGIFSVLLHLLPSVHRKSLFHSALDSMEEPGSKSSGAFCLLPVSPSLPHFLNALLVVPLKSRPSQCCWSLGSNAQWESRLTKTPQGPLKCAAVITNDQMDNIFLYNFRCRSQLLFFWCFSGWNYFQIYI